MAGSSSGKRIVGMEVRVDPVDPRDRDPRLVSHVRLLPLLKAVALRKVLPGGSLRAVGRAKVAGLGVDPVRITSSEIKVTHDNSMYPRA